MERFRPTKLPIDLNTFGGRLRTRRRELGISISALAQAMNKTLGAIQAWETNAGGVRLRDVQKLCCILKCTPNDLILGA